MTILFLSCLFVCYSRTATIVFSSSLVCYSRTATIVFSPALVCLFVCLYVFLSVCPGVFSDAVNPTVTLSHIIVTYMPE